MAKLYGPAAWIALILFAGLGILHVAALLRLVAPPVAAVFATFPIVMFGQIVMIAGLNGGRLWSDGRRLSMSQTLRGGLAALRRIPLGWRIFGLTFWYLYMPMTFFTRLVGAGETVTKEAGQLLLIERGRVIRVLTEEEAFVMRGDEFLAASVIFIGFAFAHFVCLRYLIPSRTEIISEVGVAE